MERDFHLELPRVYDSRRGEIVDFFNGEVEEEHYIVSKPTIRASDYAEWESKKYHAVLISEKYRKLYSVVWSVGEKIGAPKWLRQDVIAFIKKAKLLRTRPEFRGKAVYTYKEKYLLAVYYVVAKKRGLLSFADEIASMPCNPQGEPCYVSRKKGDKEFKKYLKIVLRYAAFIYPNHARDPVTLLDEVVVQHKIMIPEVVHKRAREIAVKLQPIIGGRKTNNVVAAVLKIALDEIMPNNKELFERICRTLKVSNLSVQNFIKYLRENNLVD